MNGNKKCSIKGCQYNAMAELQHEDRKYRLCPKHKFIAFKTVLDWSLIK